MLFFKLRMTFIYDEKMFFSCQASNNNNDKAIDLSKILNKLSEITSLGLYPMVITILFNANAEWFFYTLIVNNNYKFTGVREELTQDLI